MTKRTKRPKLHDYQVEGAKWLATKRLALLADRYGVSRGYSECADEARQTLSECEEKDGHKN